MDPEYFRFLEQTGNVQTPYVEGGFTDSNLVLGFIGDLLILKRT